MKSSAQTSTARRSTAAKSASVRATARPSRIRSCVSRTSRHQLFLEPMGLDTGEIYVQGFSSSMPFDVQRKMPFGQGSGARGNHASGLRHRVRLASTRWSCARRSETKRFPVCTAQASSAASSGYEEAAAQGPCRRYQRRPQNQGENRSCSTVQTDTSVRSSTIW